MRDAHASEFLTQHGWGSSTRVTIAGDASNRRYQRLTQPDGHTAILMDAPPEKGEDVRPFVRITDYLRAQGLSAPSIFAADHDHGFLVIEDLGDDLFARIIPRDPSCEDTLYEAAIDVLVSLHQAAPPNLPAYDAAFMTPLAGLAFDWYLLGATGQTEHTAKAAFAETCHAVLSPLDPTCSVLIQRDYHAENLLWLPHRSGVARVGLLDYQDAMIGHAAYDLVSILQDARRDVPSNLATKMIQRYTSSAHVDTTAFKAAYAVLGMQRNMRILGVFARLSMAYGKPHYVDFIPRTWAHLQSNLTHPALVDLAPLINAELPEPTPPVLDRLRAQCGKHALS